MISASTAFAEMVEGVSHVVADAQVVIDLPVTGYDNLDLSEAVESVEIDASMTTDMPDGTRLEAGYPATEATIVLRGSYDLADESKTVLRLFGQYRTDSPLYRKRILGSAVTIDVGLYPEGEEGEPERLRKFTGSIDSYNVDPATGTVTLTCIDRRNELRGVVNVPAVVTAPPYNAGLTIESARDALLRAATRGTVSSSPAIRPQCVFSAPLRRTLWAEVGVLNVTLTGQPIPSFAPGVMGSGLQGLDFAAAGSAFDGAVYDVDVPASNTNLFIQFWAGSITEDNPSPTVLAGDTTAIAGPPVLIESRGFSIYADVDGVHVGYDGGVFDWPTTVPESCYVAVAASYDPDSGDLAGTIYLNDTSTTFLFTNKFTGPLLAPSIVAIQVGDRDEVPSTATIEAVQVTTESAPVPDNGFQPGAVLDPSLNALQVIPAISGDPWAASQEMDDAEQAVSGFDEDGIFRSRNRVTLRTMPFARTITSTQSLEALQIESSAAAYRNRVQVGYTPWTFGARAYVWQATGVRKVARNSTSTFTVTLPDGSLAGGIASPATFLPETGAVVGRSYYRASQDRDGISDHPGLTVTARQTSSNTIEVTITNATALDAYLVSSADHSDIAAGTPLLWIGGVPVTQQDEILTDRQWPPVEADGSGGAASTPQGEIAVQITGNQWIQDEDSARDLNADLLSDLSVVRPLLTNVSIIPDPRLQRADRVLIVDDPDASGISEYAQIWGYTLTISASEYSMTVQARAAAKPGGWLLGVPGRSRLGVSTNL